MKKSKPLIIFGTSNTSEIAYEYFQYDSEYNVVAFSVDREYLSQASFYNLPVIPFEELEQYFSPNEHYFYAALSVKNFNRNRQKKYLEFKEKGYKPATYISSKCFIWKNVQVGEHTFIFEDNTLQPFVKIGNNSVLWSGNHIGHSSIIGDNVFIASHVVISGYCTIGNNTFIGVNATLPDNISVGNKCWVSHGAIIGSSVPDNSLVKSIKSEIVPLDEKRLLEKLG